jgi:hypothetical protein
LTTGRQNLPYPLYSGKFPGVPFPGLSRAAEFRAHLIRLILAQVFKYYGQENRPSYLDNCGCPEYSEMFLKPFNDAGSIAAITQWLYNTDH